MPLERYWILAASSSDTEEVAGKLDSLGVTAITGDDPQGAKYALLVVDATAGPLPGLKERISRAYEQGVAPVGVILINARLVEDKDLLELVQMECTELTARWGTQQPVWTLEDPILLGLLDIFTTESRAQTILERGVNGPVHSAAVGTGGGCASVVFLGAALGTAIAAPWLIG